jgi:hypothetical protein
MRVYFSETKFDFPKKINDLRVAWFREGRICISRNYKKKEMQTQNYRIIQMNAMIKVLYGELSIGFRKDMGRYAQLYKIRYPHLRKRGMSAYAVFLMVVYALVRRFGLSERSVDEMKVILSSLIMNLSVAECVRLKLLAVVKGYYALNHVVGLKKSYLMTEDTEEERGIIMRENRFRMYGTSFRKSLQT